LAAKRTVTNRCLQISIYAKTYSAGLSHREDLGILLWHGTTP
jgi:hypothetical protein